MTSRRSFLLGASASALAFGLPIGPVKAILHGSASAQHGIMLMNLANINIFQGFNPGIDAVQWMGTNTIQLNLSDSTAVQGAACFTGGYLDQYGNINASTTGVVHVVSMQIEFWSDTQDSLTFGFSDGLQWKAAWTGNASLSIQLLGAGGSETMGANSGTFTFGTPQPNGVQAVWTVNDITNPPRGLQIWQARYDAAKTAGKIFNPDWVNDVKPFGTLRFMDWMGVAGDGPIVNFSDIATTLDTNWGNTPGTTTSPNGPHSGVPIAIIARLANETGCKIHFCIPLRATDACVTAIAQAFQAATNIKVSYEFCNETWNPGSDKQVYVQTQGVNSGFFPTLSSYRQGCAWSSYRAAQMMNIIRGVYNDTTRWEGILGCEPTSATITVDALTGVNFFLTSTSSSLHVNDLFAGSAYAIYPGFFYFGRNITTIAQDSVGTVTCASHGYTTGMKLRIFRQYPINPVTLSWSGGVATAVTANYNIASAGTGFTVTITGASPSGYNGVYAATATSNGFTYALVSNPGGSSSVGAATPGMTQLDGATFTITNIDTNHFQLNVNTTSYTAWSDPVNVSHSEESSLYDLYDQSVANHGSDPVTYPTQYTYSNSQLGTLLLTGSCAYPFTQSNLTSVNQYPGFLASRIADLSGTGLEMRSYEGGISTVGDTLVSIANGGNKLFYQIVLDFNYSVPGASVYTTMYADYLAAGGKKPAKFNEAGAPSAFGEWAAIRWIPGNEINPTYQAIRTANGV